jgi:hydroxyethylthiazole kinase-like uncharacterized protein yjeF
VSAPHEFSRAEAAALIRVPTTDDDKYSRGVLGIITGSERYPGAAVLGVEAALRTGVGMVRYLGPARAAEFVLQRRPEAVSANGRVHAWLVGSGMEVETFCGGDSHADLDVQARFRAAMTSGLPLVLDAGALDAEVLEAVSRASGPAIITPHAGELARLLGVEVDRVRADPLAAGREAAQRHGVAVLLKGHTTYAIGLAGAEFSAKSAPTWLATAGAGDALAGILGSFVASHAALQSLGAAALENAVLDSTVMARLGAAAALVHGLAAQRASTNSGGGPFTVLELCAAVPAVVAELLG